MIGSGFAGLSASAFLAREGFKVSVLEKHSTPGGRARMFRDSGFSFDMGPSWYWMPDVFERFFGQFDLEVADQYNLVKLDPAFSVVFGQDDVIDIPAEMENVYDVFESIETGSADRLQAFMKEAAYKYEVGMQDLVYKPGLKWSEYADVRVLRALFRLGMLQPYAAHVRKYFKDPRLIRIMEFPVLFLGGMPRQVPALYSLMAYGGIGLGTWYPMGGMHEIVKAMHSLADSLDVEFHFKQEVSSITVRDKQATGVYTTSGKFSADVVIGTADYHHVEQELLDPEHRQYTGEYWEKRVMAPSAMIYYLGVDRKVPRLRHHNLFFDAPFETHAANIYEDPAMPEDPLFYVCAPSVTDASVAPEGCENLFILVPLSTRLEDTEELRQTCFEKVMARLEKYTGVAIRDQIIYKRTYAGSDFVKDYHALRGNAYGLANTLLQTAKLKPRIRSSKVSNLFFAGQLTVPGPGVPPALISGEITAQLISDEYRRHSEIMHHAETTL